VRLVGETTEIELGLNTYKKAYLCHANIRKVSQGDILLFYRSQDHKEITTIGVCDRVMYDVGTLDEAIDIVGRRSVYTERELAEIVESPTMVTLFKWHFDFENPLHYQLLLDEDILSWAPMSIQEVDQTDYEYIREAGGLDERFIIN
ncbi:MAG: hypothetical protein SV377_02150, partial [Halobacteria archaeon]|nr:hypothetical protein [Halobacteria archaeon]